MSATAGERLAARVRLWRGPSIIGVLLLALLGLTLALAYVPMGALNGPVTWAIAFVKMLFVALIFMKLRNSPALLPLAALAGVFWLLTLFAMTLTDYPFRQAGERPRTFPDDAPANAPPTVGSSLPDR